MDIGSSSSSSSAFASAVSGVSAPLAADVGSSGSEGLSQRALDIGQMKRLTETNKSGLMRAMLEVGTATDDLSAAQALPHATAGEKNRRRSSQNPRIIQKQQQIERTQRMLD